MNGKLLKCMSITLFVLLFPVFTTQFVLASGKEDTSPVEKREIVIGYAPAAYDATDYFGQFDMALRQTLDEAGVVYKIKGRAPLTPGDVADHVSIVEDFVTVGVDYIIFGPTDPKATIPAIKEANEAGIPLIICNSLEPLPDDAGVEVLAYCGYSHKTGGEVTGKYIVENLLKSGDKAAIIYGSAGHKVSAERGQPAKDIMENAGIEIVYEQNTNWSVSEAYDITDRVLVTYPDVKLIYGVASAMGMGAGQAIDAHGLTGDVYALGFGCITAELDMIWEGLITASIFRDAQSNGRGGADAIIRHLQGKEVPLQYSMDLIMVSGKDGILEHVPVEQMKLCENWPEMEEELKKRGKL